MGVDDDGARWGEVSVPGYWIRPGSRGFLGTGVVGSLAPKLQRAGGGAVKPVGDDECPGTTGSRRSHRTFGATVGGDLREVKRKEAAQMDGLATIKLARSLLHHLLEDHPLAALKAHEVDP